MRAHRVLGQRTEWKVHRVELVARHREQEVRLVLARIGAAPQRAIAELRVVAGREPVGADRAGAREQRRELDVLVALHARVRRLAGQVRLDEVVDHGRAELRAQIDHVVRDAEVRAHRARVFDVARPAAAARARGGASRVVEPHRHADDALAGLDEQARGDGAVDAARQRCDDHASLAQLGHGRQP